MKRIVVAILALFFLNCATIGHRFPTDKVSRLELNETTQEQVREIFGPPWRIGLEDGKPTWTYGYYRYSAFKPARTEDLVITFDENNIVSSYTFNTTAVGEPE